MGFEFIQLNPEIPKQVGLWITKQGFCVELAAIAR